MSPRPYRLTEVVTPEAKLHERVAKMLRGLLMPPAQWSTFPAGSVPLPQQYGDKLYRMGLARGWPDILVIHAGDVFGIELKRKGGGLSKTRIGRTRRGAMRVYEGQEDVFPRLQLAGMRIAVCTDEDEVMAALLRWGVPVRLAQVLAA